MTGLEQPAGAGDRKAQGFAASAPIEPALPSVFLSYARADDADGFVGSVYRELRNRGFSVWWDRVSMPSRALTFLHEIAEAISAADRLLLILSPTAARSEYVRAEWQYALAADKVVTPVLRSGGPDLLPAELKGTHCEDVRVGRDVRDVLDAMVRLASAPPPPLGRATTVPVPPPHYRPRPDQFARVAERLALERPEQLALPPQERAFTVHGMGGVGKSVLTAAVARSTATRRVFSDGVIWVPGGPEAEIFPILQRVGKELGEDVRQYANEADAGEKLRERLACAAVLIVLDNAWSAAPVELLRGALGPRCRLVITTREPGLVELGTAPVDLEPFSKGEAVGYLEERARADGLPISSAIEEVARECGFLPFALALAGAMAASTSWDRLAERLRAADLSFMQARIPGYQYTNLLRAMQVSVDWLGASDDPDTRVALRRYLEIAAFRWEGGVPEAALVTLWLGRGGIEAPAAERVLTTLSKYGLVRTEGQSPDRLVRLHDLQQDYLWALAKDRPSEHAAILDAYARIRPEAPFVTDDDGYYLDNCFYHFEQAGRGEQIHALLASEAQGRNAWWLTRIAHGQALGFVADVRRAWNHAWRDGADRKVPDAIGVARVARYALMIGSARVAMSDVPVEFIGRLLAEKIWGSEQALAVLEWVARDHRRLGALVAVLPYLPDAQKQEAAEDGLRFARAQPEEPDRARDLLQMLPFLQGSQRAQVLEEALALVEGRYHLFLEAYRVAPERPDLLERAIEAARSSADAFHRKIALLELAPVVPPDRIDELVALADGAGSPEEQAEVLIELAARLPEQQRQALATRAFGLLADGEDFKAAGVTAVKERARAVRLLPAPERQRAAIGVMDELDKLKWPKHRVAAIADVLPFLAGVRRTRTEALAFELLTKLKAHDVVELVNEDGRGLWLAQQAPEFLQPLVASLLAVAQREKESQRRISAIGALLPFIDRDRLPGLFKQEESHSQLIHDVEDRAACLAALARTLPPDLREQAIAPVLREILESQERAICGPGLAALAPVATGAQLEAMTAALQRVDDFMRGQAAAAVFALCSPRPLGLGAEAAAADANRVPPSPKLQGSPARGADRDRPRDRPPGRQHTRSGNRGRRDRRVRLVYAS